MMSAGIMAAALAIDAVVGWPRLVYQMIGHPVTWIGRLIKSLDSWLNLDGTDEQGRRVAGVAAALFVIAVAVVAGVVLTWVLPAGLTGALIAGVIAWPMIAARSMFDHVVAVARPLGAGSLAEARHAVSMIVGRDPEQLDKAGIARAALESLAENTSDGVIAPLFWGAVFGLPGILGYKAINTLDSMIGHRTPRHEAFGWASARIDDVANFIPARLTAVLFAAVSPAHRAAFDCMIRDARHHRSPNAGWPEAAMAGGLGVRLSGPRAYHDGVVDEPWLNGDAHDPSAADVERGLRLYRSAMIATGLVLVILSLV